MTLSLLATILLVAAVYVGLVIIIARAAGIGDRHHD